MSREDKLDHRALGVEPSSSSNRTVGSSIRQQLGSLMVDATDWAEEHRRALVFGSLTAAACGVALLLQVHGIPGFTRLTSNAEVAARLLQLQQRRPHSHLGLPVLLSSAQVQDGNLLIKAVHYPTLLRWYHRYKGIPTNQILQHTFKTTGAQASIQPLASSKPYNSNPAANAATPGYISCLLAGVRNVHPEVQQLLQQYVASNATTVHLLRVFAITQQSPLENCTPTAKDPQQEADSSAGSVGNSHNKQQQQQVDGSSRPALDDRGILAASAQHQTLDREAAIAAGNAFKNNKQQQAANRAPSAQERHVQIDLEGEVSVTTKPSAVIDARFPQASTHGAAAAAAAAASKEQHMHCGPAPNEAYQVWAELWVRGLPAKQLKQAAEAVAAGPAAREAAAAAQGDYSRSSMMLFSRRRDIAVQLLQYGLAEVVSYEDFEWLGVRSAAMKTYSRAAEYAQRKQLGIHAASQSHSQTLAAAWRRLSQQLFDLPSKLC